MPVSARPAALARRFRARPARPRPSRRATRLVAPAAALITVAGGAIAAAPPGVAAAPAAPAAAAAPGSNGSTAAPHARARIGAHRITLAVSPRYGAPGYRVTITRSPFRVITTSRHHRVLATTSGAEATGPVVFTIGDTTYHATRVTTARWTGSALRLRLATDRSGTTVGYTLTPRADRYRVSWTVAGASAVGGYYVLRSAGHWYGHGEAQTPSGGPYSDQPWPLDTGEVTDDEFGPASYLMTDPFWFTSRGVGIWQDTRDVMSVGINAGGDGLAKLVVTGTDTATQTVFVERTPRRVFADYIAITGTPRKSDATPEQYREPLWNTWAQYYTSVSEAKVLDYAHAIAGAKLPGHTVQIDDGWMTHYGDFAFNNEFPTPKAMSDEIHRLGFDLGLWVTLWINNDADDYQYAADHGYLLKDATGGVCQVQWWNGTAGIVDLANPAARAWYDGQLQRLERDYEVDGFKFDTRFFDEGCQADPGYTPNDYLKLGAQLVDQYDLQGAGVRLSWTGSQQYGFVTRTIDKDTTFEALRAAVHQNLAVSTIGYPFVETDMIGGSLGSPPPSKATLVRWAQAAALMPLTYSSTAPTGAPDNTNGTWQAYDAQTVRLYRAAMRRHERLAPYIDRLVRRALVSDEPIMKPVFFDYPRARWAYTTSDEWLLGDDVLAAPVLDGTTTRTVRLPAGRWIDVARHRVVRGPAVLPGYSAGLGTTPTFVRAHRPDSARLVTALSR